MAVEVLAATSLDANWVNFGGANRTISVGKPDDDAATFVSDGTGASTTFSFADSALTTETITSVAIEVRCSIPSGPDTMNVKMSDNAFVNSTNVNPTFSVVYTTDTSCSSATKPSGGAWTIAAVNATQGRLTSQDLVDASVTSLTLRVTYTPNSSDTNNKFTRQSKKLRWKLAG